MTLSGILHRLGAAVALGVAAVILSGCFVTSVHRVDGTGPDADPALAGTWRGLDEDGKLEPKVFLHVVPHKTGEGQALLFVDENSFFVMDGTTVQAGPHKYINADFKYAPGMGDGDKEMMGLHIVRYEVANGRLSLWLMDPKAVVEAIETGALKGEIEGSGATRSAKLTASSESLNVTLSKPDAVKYFQKKPAVLIRMTK